VTNGSMINSAYWLASDNYGLFEVRITIAGVPVYTQVIW
jgi:hypothetical protein